MLNKNLFLNKKQYLIIGLIAVFVILAFSISRKPPSFQNSDDGREVAEKKAVILVLDFGENGKVRKFRTLIAEGREMKAWSLLQQAAAHTNMELEIEDSFIPVKIDGVASGENGKRWQVYVNDQKHELKPFNILVKAGDEVIFKFE